MEGLQDFNEHQNTCGCISIWFEAGSWKYARYEIFSEQKHQAVSFRQNQIILFWKGFWQPTRPHLTPTINDDIDYNIDYNSL